MKKIMILIAITALAFLFGCQSQTNQKPSQAESENETPTYAEILEAMEFETRENRTLENGFKAFDIQGPLGYGSAVCGDIDEGTHIIIYDEGRDFELMNRVCEKYETLVMPVISRDTEERYDFRIENSEKSIRITVKKRRTTKTI